jgi:23S rRNA pseudouridine2605 synthase
MMNKPRGYICTRYDKEKRPTVYSLLPPEFKNWGHIMSVGRLDYNSEGLLLLTNDPQLKNLLENPVSNMNRLYRVKVHGRVTPEKLLKMSKPITMNGREYGPLRVTVDRALTTNVWLNI